MKISIYNSLLNSKINKEFKRFLFVFGFLFLGVFSQNVSAQFISVSLEVLDANAREQGSNPGSFVVSLSARRNADTEIEVLVDTSLSPLGSNAIAGTSAANGDRSSINGTVIIPEGETEFVIDVDVFDDDLVEGDEIVKLDLISVNGGFFTSIDPSADTATLVIEDNDFGEINVTAFVSETLEGSTTGANRGRFRFLADKRNNTGEPVEIEYEFSGMATSGDDFTITGVAQINDEGIANNIFILPVIDGLVEGDETVIMTITDINSDSYEIGTPDTNTVTIIDNDEFVVSIVSTDATANESNLSTGLFTVDLGAINATGSPIVVEYTVTGTATEDEDYEALSGSLSIPDGQSDGTITVTPIDDTDIEANETVVVTISPSVDYTVADAPDNSATVRVVNDDVAYIAEITASDATAAESSGGVSTGEFVVSLDRINDTGGAITVNYTIGGNAESGTDYTPINTNAINIPDGEISVSIEIAPIDDLIQEGDETVIITLETGINYVLGANATQSATVEIDDNDQATLTIKDAAINEDDPSGVLVFEVELDLEVVDGTTVSYSFGDNDDTATGGGVDYTGVDANLTFVGDAGEIQFIEVPIINDAILENTETFTIELSGPTNNVELGDDDVAIGTIQDDDNCVAAPELDTSVSLLYCIDRPTDEEPNPTFSANLFDYTNSTAPTGTVLTWSLVSDPLNTDSHLTVAESQNIGTPGSYFGFFYDADNDCASGTIEVEIEENVIPEIISVSGGENCGPGTVLLSATPSEDASINWYESLESTTPVAMGETFTTPSLNATATYYVEATENGCTTERQPVVARIGIQASAGTVSNGAICNVAENGFTVIDLDSRLVGADPGVWIFVDGPQTNVNISSTNEIDFEGFASGNYIFSFTTTDSTAPCENVTVEVTINVSDCETDDDNDGLLGGQEVVIGTDPNNDDTDGDGILDGIEVGDDIDNPLDEDDDGIIDALDSNIADVDNDGVNDQQDPANNNPCVPNRFNGSCDTDGDGISDLEEQTNGSDPDDPCDPVASPDCDEPIDLEVLKSVDNIDALIGDTVVFKILVTNLSDRTARAIVIGDLLELGFDFVSADSADYDEVSGNWSIAELNAGLSLELSITVIVAEQGPYTNTATLLESIPSDNTPENDEATVTLSTEAPEGIDLEITKTVDSRTPLLGEQITFTIRVENKSRNGDVINNIEIEDILPNGIDAGFIYVSDFSSTGDYDELTGRWSIPSLEVGEQNAATLDIIVTVPIIGTYTNVAMLIRSSPGDSNVDNNSDEVIVVVDVPTTADPGFLFNQFSPNGDNANDVLRINLRDEDSGLDAAINYKIIIHDRYGNRVFEGGEIIEGNTQRAADVWDGTYKGKEVPKGTYFYIMNYRINNDEPIIDKGWIQLIR